VVEYLRMQIRAGAQAIQLFDSWVGCLNPSDYEEYVLPHVQAIVQSLKHFTAIELFTTGQIG